MSVSDIAIINNNKYKTSEEIMQNDINYFFKNDNYKNQIINLLKKSKPVQVKSLIFNKSFICHSHGEYAFELRNTKNENFVIPFYDCMSNINDFWSFLEFITTTNETSILYIDDDGNEQILYVEHINERDVRFSIAETMEAYHRFCRNEIKNYTYEDADVLFDVVISKYTLIKQFYEQLLEMFNGWEKETEFVPWATDINVWQKDSIIIRKYLSNLKSVNIMKNYTGCLIGGAVGDALGYPVKFLSYNDIVKKYGVKGIADYCLDNGIAKIADATQLSLFTANGLLYAITRGSIRGILGPIESYVIDFYYDWFLTQIKEYPLKKHLTNSWLINIPEMFSKMSPETSVMNALENGLPLNYDDRNKKIKNNGNGYSGIVSVAPVSILWRYYKDYNLAGKISALLNNNTMSVLSSLFLDRLLNKIFHQEVKLNLKSVIIDLRNNIYDNFNKFEQRDIEKLATVIDKAIDLSELNMKDNEAIETIGKGWLSEEALGIALYCSIKYSDNFEIGIFASVNHSGNSNCTGSLTGNILGAYLGLDVIPKKFLDKLQLKDIIIEIAKDLNTECPVSEYSNDNVWEAKYVEGNYIKQLHKNTNQK